MDHEEFTYARLKANGKVFERENSFNGYISSGWTASVV
jgi:hypothetical protein